MSRLALLVSSGFLTRQRNQMSLRRSPRLNVAAPTATEKAAWARSITPKVIGALELPSYSAERINAIVAAYEAVIEGHGIRFVAAMDQLREVLECRLWTIRMDAERLNLSQPQKRKLISLYERFRIFLQKVQKHPCYK